MLGQRGGRVCCAHRPPPLSAPTPSATPPPPPLLPRPQVWDAENLTCLATLTGHTGPVRTLVRCGDKIFSGSYDKTVRVWDVHTHRCLSTLAGHSGAVRALAATGAVVFSGSDDTTIRVRGGTGEGLKRDWSGAGQGRGTAGLLPLAAPLLLCSRALALTPCPSLAPPPRRPGTPTP